jgi:glutamate dehydrogenase
MGLPVRLAESLAALEPLRVAPDLVELMRESGAGARAVARAHFGLGAKLGLDWLHAAIDQLPASGSWGSAARAHLQNVSLAAHLRLSAAALLPASRAPSAASSGAARSALTVAVETLESLASTKAPARLP